jgi:lipopolysaccharide/colanic/teichoic acid biosynthesis glycosyltransferase
MLMEQNYTYIFDGMNAFEREVKRWFDFLFSFIFLILSSPLFLYCYLRIKKDDGGKVIYKQERIGRFGRPFYIYKFRSMKEDAEKNGPELCNQENEDRLTEAGKFLRNHHLDELPQLWNVLKGDMSFVGPRPERKFYIDQIMKQDCRYKYLYQIRPGVTSYATLYNGYTDTMEKMLKRLEMDLDYLKRRSWWEDLKIMFLTVIQVARGKKF